MSKTPTQNDWYDRAVKNRGFKSGLNALKADTQNDRVPEASKTIQNDWEGRMAEKLGHIDFQEYKRIKDFIRKELADARKEVIVEHIKFLDDVLATLRKETK